MDDETRVGIRRVTPNRQQPIAPPVFCPFCRSTDTELFSSFGSQLSTAQYYCRACHTPFEHIKHDSDSADAQH
jgi:hypothetical protein